MKLLYRTSATAKGGQDGVVVTPDGALRLPLARSTESDGPTDDGTNPEQLFAAAYAASFKNAIETEAEKKGILLPEDTRVTATVGIGVRRNGQGFGLDIAVAVALPGVDHAAAERIVLTAHAACAYSHALRNGVDVRLSIV